MPTSAPAATLPAALLASRALQSVIRFLLPYFCVDCPDFASAQAEILETLAAYAPRTRAELLAAAQVIAGTLSALSVMAEAEAAEMSPAMRLRFRGCANTINRHTQQAQHNLDKRLAADPPTYDPPAHYDPAEEAAKDAEVIELVRQTQLKIAAVQKQLAETHAEAAQRTLPVQHDPSPTSCGGATPNAAAPASASAAVASAAIASAAIASAAAASSAAQASAAQAPAAWAAQAAIPSTGTGGAASAA